MRAICFYIGSVEDLARLFDYESLNPDPENFNRCVARERAVEILTCRELGFPHFFVANAASERIIVEGLGGQRPIEPVLFDTSHRRVEDLSGYSVLLRTEGRAIRRPLEFLQQAGAQLESSYADVLHSEDWLGWVSSEFLNRRMASVRVGDLRAFPFDGFRDASGEFFLKTAKKKVAGLTHDYADFFGFSLEMMREEDEVIVSEPMAVERDELGTCEYRAYVIDGRVSSVSRYLDYRADYAIPPGIEALADRFTLYHRGVAPCHYVADFAATSDRGLVLVEVNPVVAAGRYERNDAQKLVKDFSRLTS